MASGSETGANFDFAASSFVPQAMQKIAKHKAKRAAIRKGIDTDHTARLASLKNRIGAHYEAESKKTSDLEAQKLSRLVRALERRRDAEEEIGRRVGALREDCAHMAMLLGAVYEGRMRAALALAGEAGEEEEDGAAAAGKR